LLVGGSASCSCLLWSICLSRVFQDSIFNIQSCSSGSVLIIVELCLPSSGRQCVRVPLTFPVASLGELVYRSCSMYSVLVPFPVASEPCLTTNFKADI
ncbi:hypothetical protein P692DRAFT_20602250, partial [Suillus brevipes Sb2]